MSEICGDNMGDRPRGLRCFLLAGDPMGNAPVESPLLFEHFPKCIRYSLSFADMDPNTSGHFPKRGQYPLGTAQMVSKSF
jgi:hypothetical protein